MSKRIAVLLVMFLSCPTLCMADSITVTYENVYVSEHSDSFFIRIPADGTVVRLLKSGVSDSRVSLTEDENARNTLLQEWERHRKKPGESPRAQSVAKIPAVPSPVAQPATPSGQQRQSGYKVIEREDMSFATAKRILYRVEVPKPATEAELRAICNTLIEREKIRQPLNAVGFFFYLPDTDTTGHYTAGKADWAPNGEWAEANTVRSGDYSRHKLVLDVGNALGEYTGPGDTSITESKKRKIYWDLFAANDKAVNEAERMYPRDIMKLQEMKGRLLEKYEREVAREYGLTQKQVDKIDIEGVMKGWPTPPYTPTKPPHESLEIGRRYKVSKRTPLMPEFELADPLGAFEPDGAFARIKQLSPRSSIVVKRIRMKSTTPWYYVEAFGSNGQRIGEGWINSTALLGQDIEVLK